MTENDGTVDKRITGYEYDQARRVKRAKFNADGIGGWDEEVAYEYDLGGQRTRLTLPGNLSVTYTYDLKGRLVSLTDWDGHQTPFRTRQRQPADLGGTCQRPDLALPLRRGGAAAPTAPHARRAYPGPLCL